MELFLVPVRNGGIKPKRREMEGGERERDDQLYVKMTPFEGIHYISNAYPV